MPKSGQEEGRQELGGAGGLLIDAGLSKVFGQSEPQEASGRNLSSLVGVVFDSFGQFLLPRSIIPFILHSGLSRLGAERALYQHAVLRVTGVEGDESMRLLITTRFQPDLGFIKLGWVLAGDHKFFFQGMGLEGVGWDNRAFPARTMESVGSTGFLFSFLFANDLGPRFSLGGRWRFSDRRSS